MGHDPQPRVGQASDQAITVNDQVDVAHHAARTDRSRERHPRGAKRSTSHPPRGRQRQPCRDRPQASRNDTCRRFIHLLARAPCTPTLNGRTTCASF